MKIAQICLVLLIGLVSVCSSYRILGVFPFNGKSHNIVFDALVKGLAKHGHQVDVITHFPPKKPVKNLNVVINLNGSMQNLINNYTVQFAQQLNAYNQLGHIANKYGNGICHFMGFEEMQKLIKNPPKDPPYDLIIVEAFTAHCYMGFGYVFNAPVVAVSTAIEYPWISHFNGNDDNPAYVENVYRIGVGKMTFWERLYNFVTNLLDVYTFHRITGDSQTDSMKKYLHPNIPHVREVEKNISLMLVNSHPILSGIKPTIPSLVQIGGIHIEENDQVLSSELKKWMDESKSGVVFFSLGSMVLTETLPVEQLKEIYASFEKISPVRVLMKIANSTKLPPGLPKNIKIMPWIPQQAVLAHPNTKAFITHGGLGGVQEAMYFGIPIIGMPLFGDQFRNIKISVLKGMAVEISINDISETTLDACLKSILQNPKFKERAAYFSKIFKDQPISPMKNAIFWIEYVIRNGGDVLRSPALSLTWWQLDKLDIYVTLLFVILFSIISLALILRFIVKTLLRAINSKSSKKKKTH